MGNFNHLPPDIQLDIITRLPIESIPDCKLVSKPWKNLISNYSSFSRLHLTHLTHSAADSGTLSFLVFAGHWQHLYYFEYDDCNDEKPIGSIARFNLTLPVPFTSSYKVIGSFNGLVCLYESEENIACIFNPMTKHYVLLPRFSKDSAQDDDDDKYVYLSSGFGYLPLTNKYKVVGLFRSRRGSCIVEVAVYTLGDGNGWRNVGMFDTKFAEIYSNNPCVFADGVLHWTDMIGNRVLAFDLAEEKFRGHVSPPPFRRDGEDNKVWPYYTIGELGGVLFYAVKDYCLINYIPLFVVWLLKKKKDVLECKKEQEEALVWSKEFSIPGIKQPLAFTKSGSVLCYDHLVLSSFDPIASTLKELLKFGLYDQIIQYKKTFVSLEGLAKEGIETMESAKLERQKAVIRQ